MEDEVEEIEKIIHLSQPENTEERAVTIRSTIVF
jgi:hypothetical protein